MNKIEKINLDNSNKLKNDSLPLFKEDNLKFSDDFYDEDILPCPFLNDLNLPKTNENLDNNTKKNIYHSPIIHRNSKRFIHSPILYNRNSSPSNIRRNHLSSNSRDSFNNSYYLYKDSTRKESLSSDYFTVDDVIDKPLPVIDETPETMRELIMSPLPKKYDILKCEFIRKKSLSGVKWYLYIDNKTSTFLLSVKKKYNTKSSYYQISSSKTSFDDDETLGKIRLHKSPAYYSIYSKGSNPAKTNNNIRNELGIVIYNNLTDEPSDIFSILPNLTVDNEIEKIQDSELGPLYFRTHNMRYDKIIILRNKVFFNNFNRNQNGMKIVKVIY